MKNILLGFSTTWENAGHLERMIDVIAEHGFDGIEPTFLHGKLPSPERHFEDARILRSIADSRRIRIPSMRGGRNFWTSAASGDENIRTGGIEHARRALEVLSVTGGDVLLVVPGELTPAVSYEEHWKRAVKFARSIGDIAAAMGMRIGLENTEAGFPANLEDWKLFLREIDHDHVGMYLDVGNIVWQDVGEPAEWIRSLSPWIERIHFKDAYRSERLVQLLEGEVPWPAVMQALRDIDYRGWIIAEPDWYRWAPEVVIKHVMASLLAIQQLTDK